MCCVWARGLPFLLASHSVVPRSQQDSAMRKPQLHSVLGLLVCFIPPITRWDEQLCSGRGCKAAGQCAAKMPPTGPGVEGVSGGGNSFHFYLTVPRSRCSIRPLAGENGKPEQRAHIWPGKKFTSHTHPLTHPPSRHAAELTAL